MILVNNNNDNNDNNDNDNDSNINNNNKSLLKPHHIMEMNRLILDLFKQC